MKNRKPVMLGGLLTAMILSISMVGFAEANLGPEDYLKPDLDLLYEAEYIELTEKELKYDKNGKNKEAIKNSSQERHEDLVEELNSRGIYHKSQTLDNSMEGYVITNTQSIDNSINSIDVISYSPIQSNIETNDNICSPCGETHNKKLSVRSGMEWDHSVIPWWKVRTVGPWSAYVNTNDLAFSTAQLTGGASNINMYIHTKSNHAVTTAAFHISSEVWVKEQSGNWVKIADVDKSYPSVYYPYKFTMKGDSIHTISSTPGNTQHKVTLDVYAIS